MATVAMMSLVVMGSLQCNETLLIRTLELFSEPEYVLREAVLHLSGIWREPPSMYDSGSPLQIPSSSQRYLRKAEVEESRTQRPE